MKTENELSLKCTLVDNEYKFYYCDGSDPLKNKKVIRPKIHRIDKTVQTIFVFEDYAIKGLYLDDQKVVCYEIPYCKHCGSTEVIRKDHNSRKVFNSSGILEKLKLKRYECKKCKKKSQVELKDLYKPYAKIPNHIKESTGLALHNGHKTLRQQANDIELYTGVPISHETIRKSLSTDNTDLYEKWGFKTSGWVSYDAKWIPNGSKFYYRLVLIDVEYYLPIAEAVVEKEDNDTVFNFIDKSIPKYKRKGITTDSKIGYDKVMRDLGFTFHQECVFHLLKRINELIHDEVKDFKKQFKKELKEQHPNYSKHKLNRETKKAARKFREKFTPYLDQIKAIFEHDNYDDAVNTVEDIKANINSFPECLSQYLTTKFFPEYKKYLVYLQDGAKGHLEKTNNKCENYIGKIIDKSRKGKFKTLKGFFDYCLHRIEGWIKKHPLPQI